MKSLTIDERPTVTRPDRVSDRIADAVDLSVLISLEAAQADGEPDLVLDLIDLYLDDTPRRLASMSSLLEQRDALSLQRAAHCLKGSSATLGARGTAELCRAIEETAQVGPPGIIANLLTKLHQEFAHVHAAFSAERQKRTSRASKPSPTKAIALN
jgi:HPt (histidine-containing phosphotransfer) domain-containing protein